MYTWIFRFVTEDAVEIKEAHKHVNRSFAYDHAQNIARRNGWKLVAVEEQIVEDHTVYGDILAY